MGSEEGPEEWGEKLGECCARDEGAGKTNSNVGQMCVSVSGLLGCPAGRPRRPNDGKPQWGRRSQLFLLFTLAVKYLFICASKQNARQGHHLHSNTFIVVNLLHSHREFN